MKFKAPGNPLVIEQEIEPALTEKSEINHTGKKENIENKFYNKYFGKFTEALDNE